MHSTDDLDDRYLGSGRILLASIRKHGRHNHVREILEFLPDRESLLCREKEIVNHQLLADPQCMNLAMGGNTTKRGCVRDPASVRLQAQSLRRHFEDPENRERQRRINTDACHRIDVVKNIAKKLTLDDVIKIRERFNAGEQDYNALGATFHVTGTTIWMIVTRRTWKHV